MSPAGHPGAVDWGSLPADLLQHALRLWVGGLCQGELLTVHDAARVVLAPRGVNRHWRQACAASQVWDRRYPLRLVPSSPLVHLPMALCLYQRRASASAASPSRSKA